MSAQVIRLADHRARRRTAPAAVTAADVAAAYLRFVALALAYFWRPCL